MTEHEKIELPKFMCDWLDIDRGPRHPLFLVKDLCDDRFDTHVVECWLNNSDERQWLLIDALHYGYVPEPEPRWGIKSGNCYMTSLATYSFNTRSSKYAYDFGSNERRADEAVNHLGFGEVVDMNKEVAGNESKNCD